MPALIPMTLSVKASGSQTKSEKEQEGEERKVGKKRRGDGDAAGKKNIRRRAGDVRTLKAPLLARVCVFALMHLKRRLFASAVFFFLSPPVGQRFSFQKGLRA